MLDNELWEMQKVANESMQKQINDLCDIVITLSKILRDHENEINSLKREISKLKGES